jgi:hypothetical protein
MRVRENPPPFTLRLLKSFVNTKTLVSTGFLPFLSGFYGFLAYLGHFTSRGVRKSLVQSGRGVLEYGASVGAPLRISKGQRWVSSALFSPSAAAG